MLKNMTVGTRIAVGFALLLLVTMALGGIGAWNMVELTRESSRVSGDFLPLVRIFNHVERRSIEAMSHHSRFILSGEEKDYRRGLESVAQLKKLFGQARALAARSQILTRLRGVIDRAAAKLERYEQAVAKSRQVRGNLLQVRKDIEQAVNRYLQAAERYLALQEGLLLAGKQAGWETLRARMGNIKLAQGFLLEGNRLHSLVLQSELRRSPEMLAQARKGIQRIQGLVENLRAQTKDSRALQNLDEVGRAIAKLRDDLDKLKAVWVRTRRLEQDQVQVAEALVSTAQANLTRALKEVQALSGETKSLEMVMFVGLGVALLLGLVLAWVVTRSITKPLTRVIGGLRDGSQQVAAASDQVSTSSQQLAGGASQQAASLEETSASLEEITSMTRSNADNAGQADNLMSEVKRAVEEADRDMNEMASALERIAQLGDETGKIIKAIDEIAFQTNLLALNAAVEAARAGEAGAGFAVVADEVRNLAMRAAEAAKGTQGLIEEMVSGIEQSSQMMNRTLGGFEQVAQASQKVAELVSEIAVASGEQAQGVDQINLAVGELDRVTQSNAANAEEGAAAAEEMNAMAMSTHDLVDCLAAMVGGAKGNGRPPADPETRSRMKKLIPLTRGGEKSAGPDPRKMIPLEEGEGDGDFEDF